MTNKNVIVFGGSGSVGRAVCAALAADGARVAFTYYRNEKAATELLAALPGTISRPVDLASTSETQRVFRELRAELGGLDAFVHAATLTSAASEPKFETLLEADEAGFDRLLAVNVKSAYFVCAELARDFAGNIVLLGSIDGAKSVPAPAAYAASKGALSALARAASKELGPRGVKINVVAPGVLETGSSRSLPADLRAEYLKHCGLRRFGRADEVAGLVSWLALRNTYVTGQTLVVDGAL
ncbi:MAG TPA: SDR family oxidoreductase [Polyangiaceae bacterium]|nr:SDR family oxidoreductase [Polyangiaceae bacterium]